MFPQPRPMTNERSGNRKNIKLAIGIFVVLTMFSICISVIDLCHTIMEKWFFPKSSLEVVYVPGYILAFMAIAFQIPLYFLIVSLTGKDKICLKTNLFMMVMFSIVCCACVVCIYSISYHGTTARQEMFQAISIFKHNERKNQTVDMFQSDFKCCGVDNYLDWKTNLYGKCNASDTDELLCKIPPSCYNPKIPTDMYLNKTSSFLETFHQIRSRISPNKSGERLQKVKEAILASSGQKMDEAEQTTTGFLKTVEPGTVSELIYTEGCITKVEEYRRKVTKELITDSLILILSELFAMALMLLTLGITRKRYAAPYTVYNYITMATTNSPEIESDGPELQETTGVECEGV